jgi:hypothetical protein
MSMPMEKIELRMSFMILPTLSSSLSLHWSTNKSILVSDGKSSQFLVHRCPTNRQFEIGDGISVSMGGNKDERVKRLLTVHFWYVSSRMLLRCELVGASAGHTVQNFVRNAVT